LSLFEKAAFFGHGTIGEIRAQYGDHTPPAHPHQQRGVVKSRSIFFDSLPRLLGILQCCYLCSFLRALVVVYLLYPNSCQLR
jgi:hypothetical protein